jgi:hypothetical protein
VDGSVQIFKDERILWLSGADSGCIRFHFFKKTTKLTANFLEIGGKQESWPSTFNKSVKNKKAGRQFSRN